MALVRQIQDVQIVFTSIDEQTENTITASNIDLVEILDQDIIGSGGTIIINNRDGVNKSKFLEGYAVDLKIHNAGGSLSTFWLGRIVKKTSINEQYRKQAIELDVIDEGTWVLSGTNTTSIESFSSADIGAIIKSLLDDYTDFDTTNINTSTGVSLTLTLSVGKNLLAVIRAILAGTGQSFHITETGYAYLVTRGASSSYSLGETAGRHFTVQRDLFTVKNEILVKGAYVPDSSETKNVGTRDDTWILDEDTYRRTAKFTPADTIIGVEVAVLNYASSTHNLVIRIQPDNGAGTAPLALTLYHFDIARISIPNAAIDTGSDTTYIGGEILANLIDGVDDYWIIIESDSDQGNLLRACYKEVDSVDTLMFRVYVRKELTNTAGTGTDATSQTNYGVRDWTYTNRALNTQAQVDQKTAALLAEYKDPSHTAWGEPLQDIFNGARARMGQGVTVNLPDDNINSDVMGIIEVLWEIRPENGPFLAIPRIIVSDTPPPLEDQDWAAQVSKRLDEQDDLLALLNSHIRVQ